MINIYGEKLHDDLDIYTHVYRVQTSIAQVDPPSSTRILCMSPYAHTFDLVPQITRWN